MGMQRNDGPVLVLGGRSEIGLEVATRLAPGRVVILAARRADALGAEAEQVRAAGAMPEGEYTVVARGYPPVASQVSVTRGEITHDVTLGYDNEESMNRR